MWQEQLDLKMFLGIKRASTFIVFLSFALFHIIFLVACLIVALIVCSSMFPLIFKEEGFHGFFKVHSKEAMEESISRLVNKLKDAHGYFLAVKPSHAVFLLQEARGCAYTEQLQMGRVDLSRMLTHLS